MSELRAHLIRLIDQALGDNPRLALSNVTRLQRDVDWMTRRAVALARRDGYDWGRIARLTGVSRQAARQRWTTTAMTGRLPTTQQRWYRDPYRRDGSETRDLHWLAEVARLEAGGEAIAW
jgi:hypothetical protein